MKTNISKSNNGFTIIEVLIVLAIAGLIMLVVLLAVPGLQRTQANSAAKSDSTHIVAAITNYSANNNGSLPTASTMLTVYNDVSGLSKLISTYLATNPTTPTALATLPVTAGAMVTNTWYFNSATASTTPAMPSTQAWVVDVDTGAVCTSGGSAVASSYGATVTTSTSLATATSVAVLYTTEISGGSDWNCLQAQ